MVPVWGVYMGFKQRLQELNGTDEWYTPWDSVKIILPSPKKKECPNP